MFSKLFCKPLSGSVPEDEFLSEIALSKKNIWWTAINNPDGSLTFVKNKPGAQFFMASLDKFPAIEKRVKELYPDVVVKNSYVTKCMPGYHMIPHKDANRYTAIIMPLGNNKGRISFYMFGIKVYTHTYTGPTLTRVDVEHSAENDSADIRYSITIEVPGSYFENFKSKK